MIDIEGGGPFFCARSQDGSARCWGVNNDGVLGQGHTNVFVGDHPSEVPVPALDLPGSVEIIALGYDHMCALLDDNTVRCWGASGGGNSYGHTDVIGDEPGEMPPPPVDVGPGTITHLAAGYRNACVVIDNTILRCWGSGLQGEGGWGFADVLGDEPGELPPPNTNFGGGTIVEVTTGYQHTRLLLDDGTVRVFGGDPNGWGVLGLELEGPLAIGDEPGEMPPPTVDLGPSPVTMISKNGTASRTCVLQADQRVRCWGHGANGALGTNHTNDIGDGNEMPPSFVPLW